MIAFSGVALAGLLFLSILLAWAPERWAVSLLETDRSHWRRLGSSPGDSPPAPRAQPGHPSAGRHRALGHLAALYGKQRLPARDWNALLMWTTNLAVFAVALQVFSNAGSRDRFLRATLLFALR